MTPLDSESRQPTEPQSPCNVCTGASGSPGGVCKGEGESPALLHIEKDGDVSYILTHFGRRSIPDVPPVVDSDASGSRRRRPGSRAVADSLLALIASAIGLASAR